MCHCLSSNRKLLCLNTACCLTKLAYHRMVPQSRSHFQAYFLPVGATLTPICSIKIAFENILWSPDLAADEKLHRPKFLMPVGLATSHKMWLVTFVDPFPSILFLWVQNLSSAVKYSTAPLMTTLVIYVLCTVIMFLSVYSKRECQSEAAPTRVQRIL